MSARAWRARRGEMPERYDRALTVDDNREAVGMAACPYWRYTALGEPFGSCASGCWEEPRCAELGRREGLPRQLVRVLRRAGQLR